MTQSELSRFVAKIRFEQRDEDLGECWIWTASTQRGGYGQFGIDGIPRPAHRVSYEHFNGPIDEGLEIDHLCRQPACVNPRHLDATSHSANMLRAYFSPVGKSRTKAGFMAVNIGHERLGSTRAKAMQERSSESLRAKTHCRNGHPYDEAYRQKGARRCRVCQALCRRRWEQKHAQESAA